MDEGQSTFGCYAGTVRTEAQENRCLRAAREIHCKVDFFNIQFSIRITEGAASPFNGPAALCVDGSGMFKDDRN